MIWREDLIKRLAPQFAGLVHNQDDGRWIVETVIERAGIERWDPQTDENYPLFRIRAAEKEG